MRKFTTELFTYPTFQLKESPFSVIWILEITWELLNPKHIFSTDIHIVLILSVKSFKQTRFLIILSAKLTRTSLRLVNSENDFSNNLIPKYCYVPKNVSKISPLSAFKGVKTPELPGAPPLDPRFRLCPRTPPKALRRALWFHPLYASLTSFSTLYFSVTL